MKILLILPVNNLPGKTGDRVYIYNFGASSTLTFALQQRKVVVISALNFATDLLTDGENALLTLPGNPFIS